MGIALLNTSYLLYRSQTESRVLMAGPAYRIQTPRLVVRCWHPEDSALLQDAISSSLEHLRPWMPWIKFEPEELETKVQRLRRFRGEFDLGHDYVYGIFTPDERQVLGGTGLHTRIGDGVREIGYWIRAEHAGRGYATEVAAALTRVAFEVDDVRRIEIHCDPENSRSARVPDKLGYLCEAILRKRTAGVDGELRNSMIWTLLQEEYVAAAARQIQVAAFDVLGRALPFWPATASKA